MNGSTYKAVSLEWSTGAVVSSGMKSGICGMVSLHRIPRTWSSAWPSRLDPRQVSEEEAW